METTLKEQPGTGRSALLRLQLGLAFLAFILIGANDGGLGVLLPSIRTHYGIDKGTVGLLFLAGTFGYLIAAFSSGLLVEKLGNRAFLMLGFGIYVVGAALFSFMPPFFIAPFCLLLLAFGVGIIDTGLNSFIARLPRSTGLMNYLHAFYGVGALLGPVITSGILAMAIGWNVTYYLWGGFSLLLLVGFGLTYKGNGHEEHHHEEHQTGNVLAAALRTRVVWLAALFLLFYVGAEVSLGSWSFTFLTEDRHQPDLLSGWVVSGYWFGLTLGRFFLGHVADRIGSKRLIQLCLGGVVAGILVVWVIPIGIATALGLCLVGFCLGPIFPTTISMVPGLVPSRLVASSIGFMASLGSMGAALFPWMAGLLAEHVGLWTLMPYVIVITVAMLVCWLSLQNKGSQHSNT